MSDKKFLEKLKGMQAEWASVSLTKPEQENAFGYGKACGFYLGLLHAEQLFEEALEESDGS